MVRGRARRSPSCCGGSPRCPGIRRIRFTSPHPSFVDDDLVAAYGELEALCPHLHLPVQSGSDRVLAAMNRRYDRKSYLETLAAAARGAARDRAHDRPDRRLPDRDRRRLRRDAVADGRGPLHRQLLVQVLGAARHPGGAPRPARARARAGPGAPRAAPGAPARAHARRARRAASASGWRSWSTDRPARSGRQRSGRDPHNRLVNFRAAGGARPGRYVAGRRRRLHAALAARRPGRPLRLKEDPLAAEKEYGLSCTRLGPRPLAARGETLPPKARILAIDDQLYFRSFVEGLLSEAGYAIRDRGERVARGSRSRRATVGPTCVIADPTQLGADVAAAMAGCARAGPTRRCSRCPRARTRRCAARCCAPARATSCPSPSTAKRCCAPSPRWPRRRAQRTRSRLIAAATSAPSWVGSAISTSGRPSRAAISIPRGLALRGPDRVARLGEQALDEAAEVQLVVDRQYPRLSRQGLSSGREGARAQPSAA